ncbi:MAG: YraN family protein [Oceanospirillaceae bacterium]|nr:YraN family protein [Oceanospirillaceae bacterium]
MENREKGQAFERIAEQYLRAHGCHVLQRNATYRCGELDLVVTDASHLVFVEVRFRKHKGWGGALESVTWHKQRKLIRAAQLWLLQNPRYTDSTCRFDLVTISAAEEAPECVWYKDAFRPS